MTKLKDAPGSLNGTGLFQSLIALKLREIYQMNTTVITEGSEFRGGKEFFDFKATKITGEEISRLGDIVGDKKATLIVNVASE